MAVTLLLAGATGLVGAETLAQALADARITKVHVLARRPMSASHPKLEAWIAPDPDDLLSALRPAAVDAVICCLGTTIRNVGGDKQRFTHVDKDLVVALGQWAKTNGVRTFCVVSAMGADARSSVFYNRVKGEMEEALKALDLPALYIFQPSILTGPRKEVRRGERAGIVVMNALAALLRGPLASYHPMPHQLLAAALLSAATRGTAGVHVHRYLEIRALAEG